MRFIHELSDDKLKDKEVGCVSDLLKAIKALLVRCSLRELVTTVDNLRLDMTIRMLNIPHFNAKMNALKEVVRLTEEPFQVSLLLIWINMCMHVQQTAMYTIELLNEHCIHSSAQDDPSG